MDERELRRLAAEQITKPIPTWIWKLMQVDGYLEPDENDDPRLAVSRIRQLLQIGPTAAAPLKQRRAPKMSVKRTESLRARAASEYAAAAASEDDDVIRFRTESLDGQLLNHDEAERFLTSAAVALLTPVELKAEGVPALHRALIVRQRETSDSYEADIDVSPPGRLLAVHRDRAPAGPWHDAVVRGDETLKLSMGDHAIRMGYWRRSALDVLVRVARQLTDRYAYPWSVEQAIEFVLTGVTPFVAPLTVSVNTSMSSHGNRTTLTLVVEPWMSAETLVAVYKAYQARLLGRSNRPVSERRMELVRFVLDAMKVSPQPGWRQTMQAWNRGHRDWTYKNVRNMARDYWAGVRQAAFPEISAIRGG